MNIVNTVLVFAPHPDDEVLGCGGAIARRIADGWNVYVVFMTDGSHSHSHVSQDQIKTIRRKEAMKANNILGIPETNLFFLDFEDGRLKDNKKTACNMVNEILSQKQPVEVYYPGTFDMHKDHKATRSVVESCLNSVKVRPTTWQYMMRPFKGFRLRLLPLIVLEFINRKMKRKKPVRLNISEFLSLKEKALSCYESQISAIEGENPPLSSHFVDNFLGNHEEFHVRLGNTGQIWKKAKSALAE